MSSLAGVFDPWTLSFQEQLMSNGKMWPNHVICGNGTDRTQYPERF